MRNVAPLLAPAAAALLTAPAAHAGLTDTAVHAPAGYYSFLPPAKGVSYTDAVFGTSVQRVSDALATPDNASGGNLNWAMTEYASMAAFNTSNTRFILQHDSYYALYDGNGAYVKDLPFEIHASAEPRWARNDGNLLFYVAGNRLKSHNVSTGATTTLHTFSEYGAISGHGESDISWDGDHFVLAGDGRYVFVYRISNDTKGTVLDSAGNGWNSLYITPNNNVLISYYASGAGRFRGIELFNANMQFVRQVTTVGGHMDVTKDTDGSEVLVWTNAGDTQPICDNGIVKVKLATAAQTCLVELDWSLAVHVSCPDQGGCIVGTYAPSDPDPDLSWPAYTNELLQVSLSGAAPTRILHHRSRPLDDYNYTPRAAISRDGSKLLFSSNYGLQDLQGKPANYSDAYLVQLGGAPPPPPGGAIFSDTLESGNFTKWSNIAD
jgi:hypothetical protein